MRSDPSPTCRQKLRRMRAALRDRRLGRTRPSRPIIRGLHHAADETPWLFVAATHTRVPRAARSVPPTRAHFACPHCRHAFAHRGRHARRPAGSHTPKTAHLVGRRGRASFPRHAAARRSRSALCMGRRLRVAGLHHAAHAASLGARATAASGGDGAEPPSGPRACIARPRSLRWPWHLAIAAPVGPHDALMPSCRVARRKFVLELEATSLGIYGFKKPAASAAGHGNAQDKGLTAPGRKPPTPERSPLHFSVAPVRCPRAAAPSRGLHERAAQRPAREKRKPPPARGPSGPTAVRTPQRRGR